MRALTGKWGAAALIHTTSASRCFVALSPDGIGRWLRSDRVNRAYSSGTRPGCLYATLGVSRRANQSEIKAAYMDLAKLHHPDRHQSFDGADRTEKAAHDRFAAITAAFDVLGDEFKRREYNIQYPSFAGAGTGGGGGGGQRTWENQHTRGFEQGSSSGSNQDEYYSEFHSGESPYKLFSNATVVWLASVWMVAGAVFHYCRFVESHDEVQAHAHQQTRTAANHLDQVYNRARENGTKLQLEMLRDVTKGPRERESNPGGGG